MMPQLAKPFSLFVLAVSIAVAACSNGHAVRTSDAVETTSAHAVRTPDSVEDLGNGDGTYPVSAAFGPHAVKLSAAQRHWLMRILRTPAYAKMRNSLAFALLPYDKAPPPLLVFPETNGGYGDVIGRHCSYYSPDGFVAPGPVGSCLGTPQPPVAQ